MKWTHSRYHATNVKDTWLLQALSIIGSSLSIGVIAILLAHYNSQPSFDWNGVTLNAIVSVLTTLAKALLAFTVSDCLGQAKWIWFSWHGRPVAYLNMIDGGSRGPLGSLMMLFNGQVARSFLSFGAILVIISVAIDPFTQLTVGKQSQVLYEDDASAQISYAKRYSKGTFGVVSATLSESLFA